MPITSHVMYLRQVLPYLDYYNKTLSSFNQETSVMDMRVILYTDISNLAYQIISQNSKQLKATLGYKNLSANVIRFKIVYYIVVTVYPLNDPMKRKKWAESLGMMHPSDIFDFYRLLAFYLEWIMNNPANMFLLDEIKKKSSKIYEVVTFEKQNVQLTPEMKKVIDSLPTETGLVQEHHLRHEFVTLNDYVRKANKIVTTLVDDEMVLVEIKRFIQHQGMWLEASKLESIRG